MKKFLVFGAVLAIGVLAFLDFKEQEESTKKVRPRGFEVRRQAGIGSWNIPGRSAARAITVAPAAEVDSPLEIAEKYLRAHTDELGLRPYHEFRPAVFQNPLGARVSYQVYQDGVPVVGSELRLQIGKNQDVIDVDNRYVALERVVLKEGNYLTGPQLQELVRVSNYLPDPSGLGDPSRVIFPLPGSTSGELAYVISAREPSGSRRPVQILLRATDGQVLGKTFSRMEFH